MEAPGQIRAFIALKVPEAILQRLGEAQSQLRERLEDISWTRPDAMHLTLHFLGDISSGDVEPIRAELAVAAAPVAPFELEVFGLGSFGNRVIWAGLQGDTPAMQSFANSVRQSVSRFGSHQEDREFSGHITLGRRRQRGGSLSHPLRAFADLNFGRWVVDRVELIRSELHPQGARYTVLAAIPFTARA